MSIWDEPELQPDGEYISFAKVGDVAAGTVKSITVQRWDDGSVAPKIQLLCDDGEEKTLTAGQVKLKAALQEQRPEVGDHITVTLTSIEPRGGGKTLKHFDVVVARATGAAPKATGGTPPASTTASVGSDATPVVDPAALAAAMAGLTAEQLTALGLK